MAFIIRYHQHSSPKAQDKINLSNLHSTLPPINGQFCVHIVSFMNTNRNEEQFAYNWYMATNMYSVMNIQLFI